MRGIDNKSYLSLYNVLFVSLMIFLYKSEMSDKGLLCLIAHFQYVSGFTYTNCESQHIFVCL